MVVLEPPHNPPLKQTANIIRLFPPSSLKALRLHVCNILQTSYGRTRAHALGMRAHMPSYAATASMKHAQHVQTISSRWCKRIIQKHGLGMVPVCGPKNGRASAGRPEDIHCECLGPVPRPCVQKLGARIGPRRKQFFGAASQSAMISAGQKRLFACSKTSYGRTCSCHCSLWSWWRRASRNFMARQSAAMLASATLK